MSREIQVGPGQPCFECGEDYGQHTKECLVPKKEREAQARQDSTLGMAFMSAINYRDFTEIGRIIRTGVAKRE